ncbi:MAG: hypothetical protein QOI27_1129, partial [Gaiellaceae bacterium]|nr:hypothetical protein [Gaiellaceae bacterium]
YRAADQTVPRRETLKFHLMRRVLRLRADYPEAFFGAYEPLDVGPDRVGFLRGGRIRVVVPLRPSDWVEVPGDLLPQYPQELSLLR